MKPAYNKTTRRQFLMGAGGLVLPLPLLPSLFPGNAQAQVVQESAKRYFVHTTTYHAVFASQFYGALQQLTPTEKIANYAGFEIRKANLAATAQANGTFMSPILQTKTAPLPAKLLGLMNVINGLDMITASGHNNGGALGGGGKHPTIDQVLAGSKKLFPSTRGAPAIVRNKVSLTAVNGGTQATTNTAQSNVKLFDLLFGTTTSTVASKPLIVDAVREHHNAVRADPNLSAECRTLMDNHVEMMFQAESNVRAQADLGTTATRPGGGSDTAAIMAESGFVNNPARQGQIERLWNEVVVAAFASGLSQIYAWGPDDEYTFSPIARAPWHDGIAHALNNNQANQDIFNSAVQLQFESGLVDMANRMDAVRTADGKTLLDKGLLALGFEMGSGGEPGHHHGRCIPVVSIGNAGGFFNTGLSVDYRDYNSFAFSAGSLARWQSGLTYNQWMAMILRSMGLQPSEYSTNNGVYGYPSESVVNSEHPEAVWGRAGADLPFLRGAAAPPTF